MAFSTCSYADCSAAVPHTAEASPPVADEEPAPEEEEEEELGSTLIFWVTRHTGFSFELELLPFASRPS